MRILFAIPSYSWLRYNQSVLVQLANRGHDLYVAAEESRWRPSPLLLALAAHPRVQLVEAPSTRSDGWEQHAVTIRSTRSYLHSLGEPYAEAPHCRRHAGLGFVLMLARLAGANSSPAGRESSIEIAARCRALLLGMGALGRANLEDLLRHIEDVIPTDPGYGDFIERIKPDVLLLTPLLGLRRSQTDVVKSARAAGVPTGLIVSSWDNLTTKGLMHVVPDRVFVWNGIQSTEAQALHGVSRDRIVVTGTARFDSFFELQLQASRQELCDRLGFDASQPIVFYAGSSKFVADDEVSFVARWLEEIRRSPRLQAANVLIRPHPGDPDDWSALHSPADRTAVVPSSRSTADQSLFDALHHSSVVVALNTSLALEAAIMGRPVVTIKASDFAHGQEGSVHFWYLLQDRGGVVKMSEDFDAHRQDLAAAVDGAWDAAAIRRFAEGFVRPLGINRPVAPIVADAIEAWVQESRREMGGRRPQRPGGGARVHPVHSTLNARS